MEREVLGSELTDNEKRITDLAMRGMSDAEIAACIGDTIRAIEERLRRIKSKLGVSHKSQIAAKLQ